jgi:RNA polymerase sigma factor (sigma-70 family)
VIQRPPRIIRDRIVETAARMVSRRLHSRVPWEELYDLGLPGLHLAKLAWDGRGMFEAFAHQRIRWVIIDELRKRRRTSGPMAMAAAELAATEHARSVREVAVSETAQEDAEGSIDDIVDGGGANFFVDVEAATVVEDDAERIRLRRAVKELPPPEDKVIEAYYYEGMTFAEIAEELGMGETTANDAHARAVRRLKKLFKETTPDVGP